MKQHVEIHWDGGFDLESVILLSEETNKPQPGCKQSYRFWCEDNLIEAGSSVTSNSLCVVRMHQSLCTSLWLTIERAHRVESHTTAIAMWLPTSKMTTAPSERGWICINGQSVNHNEPSVEHAKLWLISVCHNLIHLDCHAKAGIINPGCILASSQDTQRAQKKGKFRLVKLRWGMSPSCKHFLSGREHFLNPGATKPCLYFPPNNCR